MKLIEADAKRLLRDAGITVPAASRDRFPLYVKAQVLEGRRGKRGWVRRCSDAEELAKNISELEAMLRDTPHAEFLCETELPHEVEWLVSLTIDRDSGQIVGSVSEEGGVGVSAARSFPVHTPEDIGTLDLPNGIKKILASLFDAFQKHDALSIEINPLAVLADGSCVALDAKIELDDAAAFRHPEWAGFTALPESGRVRSEREEAYTLRQAQAGHRGTFGQYVELDGDIAMILSGGGASLVAMDALRAAGGRPANYVEMSGNPDPEAVREASRIVLSKPGIRAIWIAGSFANFTDIQATVMATIEAVRELGLRVPIVIRRDGPNAEAAKKDAERWASEHGVSLRFDFGDVDLDQSAAAAVAASRV
ncbi:hypothetical protein HY479_00450 [Candidatus Uhrbacteria bacterium]|nr:hypothetical protein [Candidatus Uhrbacteria bacterium]